MKKIFYTAIFSAIAVCDIQALLVVGDPQAATGDSFSFDVGFAVFDTGSDNSAPRLWIANNDATMSTKPDNVKPYGLCLVNQLASYVLPGIKPIAIAMTNQENATIYTFDGTTATATSQTNPLWGGTFSLFDVSAQKPAFVLTTVPPTPDSAVYSVLDIQRLPAQTNPSENKTELLMHDFGAGEQVHALLKLGNTIFAAHATGAFGTNPSKITKLDQSAFVKSEIKDKEGKVVSQITVPYLKVIADTAINVSTSALKAAGADLAALGSSVTFGSACNNLYIGVDATANAGAGDRAIALTYATMIASSAPSGFDFVFNKVIPDSVATAATFDTVVSTDTGNQVRITNIAGMNASTGLCYLIVARDNGTGPQTIYALPIVSQGTNAGQVADFTSIDSTFTFKPTMFNTRNFDTVISDAEQINPANLTYQSQLIVGGTNFTHSVNHNLPLDAGNSIKQLYVVGDTVYVVIGDNYTNTQAPGTYQSQALFDKDGHIIGWTAWTRALGTDRQQNSSFVDKKTISGFYVAAQTFANIPSFRSVHQTTFTTDMTLLSGDATKDVALAPFFGSAFSFPGGVQGVFNFPNINATTLNQHISGFIATGFGKISLYFYGLELPLNSDSRIFHIDDNGVTYNSFNDDTQHAIIAADIAQAPDLSHGIPSAKNMWIFYGGIAGLSTLINPAEGRSFSNYDATTYSNLVPEKVGNFSSIKKILGGNSGFVYILTSTELYRIALDTAKFTIPATIDLNPELILSAKSLSAPNKPMYFLDCLIDNNFGILGTTNGMFQFDTTTGATNKINIPDGLPAASRLNILSPALNPKNSFKDLSNLYVLTNSFGSQQARINRFAIINEVITPFDDYLIGQITSSGTINGVDSSYVKFDDYMSNYFTNGAWNLASSYYLGPNQPSGLKSTPLVQQLFAGIRAGFSSSRIIMPMLSAYAPLLFINGASNLAGFIQDPVSGALIISGDFTTYGNV